MKRVMSVLIALMMVIELSFVGGTEVYAKGNAKKGKLLKKIYFEYPKNPVEGMTAGEYSDIKISSDPAGAIRSIFVTELNKEVKNDKKYSAWMVSNDGKKYRVMKPEEKFENGKYYGYNSYFILCFAYSLIAYYETTIDTKVVSGCCEDAEIYVNGLFVEDDIMESGVVLGKLEEGKAFDNTDIIANGAKVGSTISDGKFIYKVKTKLGYNKASEVELVKAKKKYKKVEIPESVKYKGVNYVVKSIKANAFKNNKKLKSVTISGYVKTIGAKAFYGCKKLTNVKIDALAITKIGKKAFVTKGKKITFRIPIKYEKNYAKLLKKAKTKNYKIINLSK